MLAEAGLADGAQGVRLFADPATSAKIPALERVGFRELAGTRGSATGSRCRSCTAVPRPRRHPDGPGVGLDERQVLMAILDHDPSVPHDRPGLLIIADKGYMSREIDGYLAERGVRLLRPSYRSDGAVDGRFRGWDGLPVTEARSYW